MKIISLSISILSLLISCTTSPSEKDTAQAPDQGITQNDLPLMQISLLNGTSVQAKELKGNVIIILFQPDCDHCQHEAVDISQKLEAFKNHDLYFLSSATPKEIDQFSRDYKLYGHDNIHFGMVGFQPVIDNFGPIPAPSVYIYTDGRLQRKFNGQTDIGVIVQAL